MLVDRQHERYALLHSCQSLSVSQCGTSAAKNYTGCFRGCLELSPETSCDSSPSHAPCCLIWDTTQPAQPINPAYATHHHLVLVASIDSDLLDKIVLLAALGSAMWWPLTLLLRSLPTVRIIVEINGAVVYTSTGVDSCSSRHFTRSRSRQSSPLKLLVCHSFAHSPWQRTSSSQTRTSRFDMISTSCVALRPTRSHPAQRRCALIVDGLVLPTSHHALTPWRYVCFSLPVLDNFMTT